MSAKVLQICPRRSVSSQPDTSVFPKLARALAATAASLVVCTWLASCATDRLESAPPKGVSLSGDWQLDPYLSDDPAKPPINDSTSPNQMRHRSGRGRGGGGVGLPPFGNPAGAGGPTGGTQPDGTEDFTSNTNVPSPYVRTLWQNPSGGSARGAGGGTRGNRWLDAPIRMTIDQKGNRLTIQGKSSGGEVQTDELVSGHSSDIPVGQNTADRDVGWRGPIFVVDTKFKSGPTKEDDYALDDEGHLIVSTFVSGGHVKKSQLKRVYDRVTAAQGAHQ
jgi:hypothetical protein